MLAVSTSETLKSPDVERVESDSVREAVSAPAVICGVSLEPLMVMVTFSVAVLPSESSTVMV